MAKYTAEEPKFTQIPDWILWHPELSGNDKQVYGTLRRFANFGKGDVKGAKPGMRRIASLCKISKTTVAACIVHLERVRAIDVDRSKDASGRQRVNEYHCYWYEPVPISDTGPVPISDTGPVPMVGTYREPSLPRPTDIAPKARNEHFDALTDLFGYTPTNKNDAALFGSLAKTVSDAPPHEVKVRADRYRALWPKMSLTPAALLKHWGYLGGPEAIKRTMVAAGGPTTCHPHRWEDIDPNNDGTFQATCGKCRVFRSVLTAAEVGRDPEGPQRRNDTDR